jgi:hypothetical protein
MLRTMSAKLAVSAGLGVWLLLASACGQQTAPAPTHASATQKKGQIAQPEVKPGKAADASSLLITFHGCADLVLSDPRGRKLGYDAATRKNYQQIPGGIYDEGDLISPPDEAEAEADAARAKPAEPANAEAKPAATSGDCTSDKVLQVPQPPAGTYDLTIDNSTGNPFKLEITTYGAESKQNGHFAVSRPAAAPGALAAQFQLPATPDGVLGVKIKQTAAGN